MPETTSDQKPTIPQEFIDQAREIARQEALAELFPNKGFKTLEDAKQSVINQANSASALVEQMTELRRSQDELLAASRTNTFNANQSVNQYDPFAALKEDPFNAQHMQAAIDLRANQIVDQKLDARLNPLFNSISARGRVAQVYPEYAAHEQEILALAQKDPELSKRLTSDPDMAMELATLRWKASQPATGSANDKDVANGSIPGNTTKNTRNITQTNTDDEQKALLAAAMRGDERETFRLLLKDSNPILPPHMR